jgi:hypothetical protein
MFRFEGNSRRASEATASNEETPRPPNVQSQDSLDGTVLSNAV